MLLAGIALSAIPIFILITIMKVAAGGIINVYPGLAAYLIVSPTPFYVFLWKKMIKW